MGKDNSILLIACDAKLANIYGRKFEKDGWWVEVAGSIMDGDRELLKLRPSVILLDSDCTIDLPGEIKRFRKMPTIQNVKIVVVAPSGHQGQIKEAYKAGADLFLIQGHFSPSEMVQKMKKLIVA